MDLCVQNIIVNLLGFKKMCMCSPQFSSYYGIQEKWKKQFALKLPKIRQQREVIKKQQQLDHSNWQISAKTRKADIIFINCSIYTMQDDCPKANALAILKDRILCVGKDYEVLKTKDEKTKIIDLNGKTLLPGFIDPHVHMAFSSLKHWIQLSPFVHKDMDEVREKIIEVTNSTKEGEWALFQLFDPMITIGAIDVSIKALDKISTTNPIFILEANGHVAHVNSKAFEIVGINKESDNPPHGRYIRDSNGDFTGQLQESAIGVFSNKIPKMSGPDYINNFQKFISHASSKGCTTLHDCGIGLVSPDSDLYVLHQVFKDPAPVRYSGYLVSTYWNDWMKKKMKPEYKDNQLRINGVKCWVDGSTQAGSAFLHQPYMKAEWGVGAPNYEQQNLNSAVLQAHKNGFQVGIHANGDAGIDMALKAFDHAQKIQKKSFHLRHRIQHSTVCHRQQLIKMSLQGVSPSFLIGHVYYYGGVFRDRILGPERALLVDPMKSALDCGLIPTIHSDYNCQPIDPLRCIYNAVTRIMKQNGEVLNYKECVTPYQAIKAMTINAAWQCHMEDIVGSLLKGKFADFVILQSDPMKVPEKQIINIKIWQTWKGGQKWYQG